MKGYYGATDATEASALLVDLQATLDVVCITIFLHHMELDTEISTSWEQQQLKLEHVQSFSDLDLPRNNWMRRFPPSAADGGLGHPSRVLFYRSQTW